VTNIICISNRSSGKLIPLEAKIILNWGKHYENKVNHRLWRRGTSLSAWDDEKVQETMGVFVQVNHRNRLSCIFCFSVNYGLDLSPFGLFFKRGAHTLSCLIKFVYHNHNLRLSPDSCSCYYQPVNTDLHRWCYLSLCRNDLPTFCGVLAFFSLSFLKVPLICTFSF